jgi:hypothetical protein
MKKFFVMFAIATALVACNDSASSTEKKADSTATPDTNTTVAPAAPVTPDTNTTVAPATGDTTKAAGDTTKK